MNAVQLLTESFSQQSSTPKDTDFAPGRIIDLVVLYGDPVCRADVSPDDATVRVEYDAAGQSGTLTLPVDHHGVRVLDDRSLNGIQVNGRRVEWSPLADGDEISIGRHTLYFLDTVLAPRATEAAALSE